MSASTSTAVQPLKEPELDEAFVRLFRSGDAGAFAAAVRALTPRVRRMAAHYFQSPFEQEDAIQEVFLLLHRQREAVDPLRAETFAPFVMTLARRRMIDLWRARKGEAAGRAPSDGEAWVDRGPDPSERAADEELMALLSSFEAKLKPAYRAFFRAAFVEGRDFEEARSWLGLGRLRARYLKRVLLGRLRRHRPLLEYLGRAGR